MRRPVAALLLAASLFFVAPAVVRAQSPAPVTEEGDDGGRPWGRLLIFVPLSIGIGAAAIYGRRAARDRGWTQS